MEVEELIAGFNFSMLKGKVDLRIIEALTTMGLEKPTRIQAETLPHLLQGKDIIGTAKTGSGKTLAFLIPVVDYLIKMEFSKKHGTGCIILSPTRELALQTCDVLNKLLVGTDLTHGLIVGGGKKNKDTDLIRNGISIVVSTPGRLLDHLKNTKEFNCKNLKCLVVDEADKLLEAGFERELNGIIKLLPKTRQTVLFSATINDKVQHLARLALRSNPELISIKDDDKSRTVSGLKQGYFLCPMDKRIPWLFKMLKKSKKKKVMVFFSSCKSVSFHYEFFRNYCEARVMQLHGQLTQPKRREAFQEFLDAKNGTLFCTDIAARGLDFPSVDWIVQYDPPTDPREYIHRVGRTARGLNTEGNAVLVLRPEEEEFLTYLRQENITLDRYTFEEPSDKISRLLEDLVKNNGVIKLLARRAYLGYLRNYRLHPMRSIFNLDTLDLATACKAFGFTTPPHSDIHRERRKKVVREHLDRFVLYKGCTGGSRRVR